jgi:hypothetical protein
MANYHNLTERWQRSGLTQRAFCEREGIKLSTFTYWRGKARRRQEEAPPPGATSFTEVRLDSVAVPGPDRCIEIRYPDGTLVRIPLPTIT